MMQKNLARQTVFYRGNEIISYPSDLMAQYVQLGSSLHGKENCPDDLSAKANGFGKTNFTLQNSTTESVLKLLSEKRNTLLSMQGHLTKCRSSMLSCIMHAKDQVDGYFAYIRNIINSRKQSVYTKLAKLESACDIEESLCEIATLLQAVENLENLGRSMLGKENHNSHRKLIIKYQNIEGRMQYATEKKSCSELLAAFDLDILISPELEQCLLNCGKVVIYPHGSEMENKVKISYQEKNPRPNSGQVSKESGVGISDGYSRQFERCPWESPVRSSSPRKEGDPDVTKLRSCKTPETVNGYIVPTNTPTLPNSCPPKVRGMCNNSSTVSDADSAALRSNLLGPGQVIESPCKFHGICRTVKNDGIAADSLSSRHTSIESTKFDSSLTREHPVALLKESILPGRRCASEVHRRRTSVKHSASLRASSGRKLQLKKRCLLTAFTGRLPTNRKLIKHMSHARKTQRGSEPKSLDARRRVTGSDQKERNEVMSEEEKVHEGKQDDVKTEEVSTVGNGEIPCIRLTLPKAKLGLKRDCDVNSSQKEKRLKLDDGSSCGRKFKRRTRAEMIADFATSKVSFIHKQTRSQRQPALGSIMKKCDHLLTELWAEEDSSPFINAVDKKLVPDYYEIVKNPITLKAIASNVRTFAYTSLDDFLSDMELMYQNCRDYNTPSSVTYACGQRLEITTMRLLRKFFPRCHFKRHLL